MAFGKKKEDEFFVMFRDFAKALAVMGAGTAKRASVVRWGLAGNIFTAWVVTLTVTMILGAAVSILFNLIY